MAPACHCSVGEIVRQASLPKAAGRLVAHHSGFNKEEEYLYLSQNRRQEIENIKTFAKYRGKIKDVAFAEQTDVAHPGEDESWGYELPF